MKINALLNENIDSGTVKALPVDKDLIYKARTRYPGYDAQQALSLYIAHEMTEKDKVDSNQNKLIDTQKRENARLRSVVDDLGQELQDFERQSQETDREVDRLKQLSGNIKQDMPVTKRKAKVSADEIQNFNKSVEMIQPKPGMDPQQTKEVKREIVQITSNPSFDDKDLKKIKDLVSILEKQKTISTKLYAKVKEQLKDTQTALDQKEGRFSKYIDKKKGEITGMQSQHAEDMKKYANIIDTYKDKIQGFDDFMKQEKDTMLDLRASVQQDAEDINKIVSVMKDLYSTARDKTQDAISTAQTQAKTNPSKFQDLEQNPELAKGRYVDMQLESTQLTEQNPIIYKDWNDPEFNAWMDRNLIVLMKLFKSTYARELSRKQPTYGDGQISYELQEEAWYLKRIFDSNDPIITKQKMDSYLAIVKMALFKQPVELSHQEELPLSESLDTTYSRMLDKIIGLPYI